MSAHTRRASIRRFVIASVVSLLVLALAVPAASAAPKTKLISQSTGGDQTAADSFLTEISANGGSVVFSTAGRLVASDTNGETDVYRRVIGTKKTKLVSRDLHGGPGNAGSWDPSISGNGRYVVFASQASDLIPAAADHAQVYRRDLSTGKTKLVSKGAEGAADRDSYLPGVSPNGRYVVFVSSATNLTKKKTHGYAQVYLRDMKLKKTYLISQAGGEAGDGWCDNPVVSADGRFVAFQSLATNLWPKSERGYEQILLRDRKLGKTYLISKNPSKRKAGDGFSQNPAMSDDGRFIVFESAARNLVEWGVDSNGHADVYRYDRTTKRMARVSLNWKGKQLLGGSWDPDISADGKFIVFESTATNVIKGGTSGAHKHVYRRGPKSGSVRLVSRNDAGRLANAAAENAKASVDGRFVVYESQATNLTKGVDDNGSTWDVFRSGPF